MKKWTMIVPTTLLTLIASVAFASVPQDSAKLGGIGYGTDSSYVQQLYGSPSEVERKHTSSISSGVAYEYEYGDSVSIHVADGKVYRIEVSANNGWQTPEGVHVGMDASVVQKTYGVPDMTRGDKFIYTITGTPDIGMEFEIENGKIDEIEIGKIK
jgi:hypothetical protein